LVTSNYVYNDINVGSFQYCLIKSFAEKKTYKDSRERWEKETKLLDEAIQKKLDDKIKKFKANPSFSSQERFETWYQEVKKLNSLVSYNYVAGNKIQIGVFQDCLIRSLSNRINNYKEYLPQWQEKINILSDTIRNEINIRIEVSKLKVVKIV